MINVVQSEKHVIGVDPDVGSEQNETKVSKADRVKENEQNEMVPKKENLT